MRPALFASVALFAAASLARSNCDAQTVSTSDFSQGGFAVLGWKVKGDWDVFDSPKEVANNPGSVARFAANKPDGSLTKSFAEIKNPPRLSVSLNYGWGWGAADQAADAIAFRLLDPRGDGYQFEVHRAKARWAVQWAKVARSNPRSPKTWASEEIDASRTSVRDGGGLSRLTITRESDGAWSITGDGWNKGAGSTVRFSDASTTSFSQLVLLGTRNFDEQLFNKIVLAVAGREVSAVTAIPVTRFLNSIGVNSTFPDRGQPLPRTIELIKYAGFRWVRGGIEGLSENGPTTVETYLELHRQTGARFSWGLVSGGTDLKKLLETARRLAASDALLAFEGNNEPNNWGVTYQGASGGGRAYHRGSRLPGSSMISTPRSRVIPCSRRIPSGPSAKEAPRPIMSDCSS